MDSKELCGQADSRRREWRQETCHIRFLPFSDWVMIGLTEKLPLSARSTLFFIVRAVAVKSLADFTSLRDKWHFN
jgi:hypothetical protein